jgi:hypothetical protein
MTNDMDFTLNSAGLDQHLLEKRVFHVVDSM